MIVPFVLENGSVGREWRLSEIAPSKAVVNDDRCKRDAKQARACKNAPPQLRIADVHAVCKAKTIPFRLSLDFRGHAKGIAPSTKSRHQYRWGNTPQMLTIDHALAVGPKGAIPVGARLAKMLASTNANHSQRQTKHMRSGLLARGCTRCFGRKKGRIPEILTRQRDQWWRARDSRHIMRELRQLARFIPASARSPEWLG